MCSRGASFSHVPLSLGVSLFCSCSASGWPLPFRWLVGWLGWSGSAVSLCPGTLACIAVSLLLAFLSLACFGRSSCAAFFPLVAPALCCLFRFITRFFLSPLTRLQGPAPLSFSGGFGLFWLLTVPVLRRAFCFGLSRCCFLFDFIFAYRFPFSSGVLSVARWYASSGASRAFVLPPCFSSASSLISALCVVLFLVFFPSLVPLSPGFSFGCCVFLVVLLPAWLGFRVRPYFSSFFPPFCLGGFGAVSRSGFVGSVLSPLSSLGCLPLLGGPLLRCCLAFPPRFRFRLLVLSGSPLCCLAVFVCPSFLSLPASSLLPRLLARCLPLDLFRFPFCVGSFLSSFAFSRRLRGTSSSSSVWLVSAFLFSSSTVLFRSSCVLLAASSSVRGFALS